MSGPLGVMSVILLEAAVGGAVVLWASGVWGAVRRGFFLLIGSTLALSAIGAWAITRSQVSGPQVTVLGIFAALLVAWQVLLVARQEGVSRVVGLAGTAVGVAGLVMFGLAHGVRPGLAVLELALGALFLGSTLYGLLLGHWYLVERRLSNVHMIRSARWYAVGVAAAVGAAVLSAQNPPPDLGGGFSPVLVVPGFSLMLAVGLVAICALIAGFVWKLAGEGGRSIQAATGMFYLAVIMAFSAELSTKFRFF